MKKYLKWAVIVLVAAIFVGTFVFLFLRNRKEEVKYELVSPQVRDIVRSTIATGKIEPRDEVAVKPQISGIISEICKSAGQTVEKNEVIAKIKVIPDMSSLSSAESRVRLAAINYGKAKADYERQKVLYDKGLVSRNEYEQAEQTFLQAEEEKAAAGESLEIVRDGVSSNNASLSTTLIRSTIVGLMLDIPVKVGNSVILSNTFNDGTTIATVADMSNLIFRGNVDETEVGAIHEGMNVSITIGAMQNLKLNAVLEYISPKAVEVNGANQFEIKAAVDVDGKNKIRSGYSANAEIVLGRVSGVLSVPESVVEFSGDSAFVYVYDSKTSAFSRRFIETGMSDGINIEVKKGITKQDKLRGAQLAGKSE